MVSVHLRFVLPCTNGLAKAVHARVCFEIDLHSDHTLNS